MKNLYIEDEDNIIILKFIDSFKLKSRHKMFFRRKFEAEIDENKILIHNIEKFENLISELCDFLDKNRITYSFSKKISQEINNQILEEKAFEEFSLEAKKIWNNEFEINDFNLFQSVLKNRMKRILYPLQLLSAYHLAFSQNAANFSVPGAGKTSIVYGAFSYLSSSYVQENKKIDKILVIGPLSSFGPWENEYEECFKDKIVSKRISGSNLTSQQKKAYFYSENTAKITLLSYQAIIHQKENLEFFLKNNSVMVVLDEAHKIKNTKGGAIAEIALSLAKHSKSRVVLTGTPAPNGYQDLYNLFKFIWPSKNIVKHNIFQLEEMNDNEVVNQELIDNISPFFVRITKGDLKLPPKNEIAPIYVEMDSVQSGIYSIIEKKIIKSLDSDPSDSFLGKLKSAKLIRMMQAASNPLLLRKPIVSEYGEEIDNYYLNELDQTIVSKINEYSAEKYPQKFYAALEIINQILLDKQKVIVWAIYVDTIKTFNKFLSNNGIKSKILYGETPIENEHVKEEVETREKIIEDFHNANSDFKVIIANPFAVAESISLHKTCHNAIYLERNFDAARFVQSKDRIHRYGLSKETVTNYYYLVSKNTIEETIHRRLNEKERVMEQIMESREIPLFSNLREEFDNDVKAVINDYVNRYE